MALCWIMPNEILLPWHPFINSQTCSLPTTFVEFWLRFVKNSVMSLEGLGWGGGGGVWQIWSCVSDRSALKTVNKTWKTKETNEYKRNRYYYSRRYLHRSYCVSKYMDDQVSEEIAILRGLRRRDSNSPNSPQQPFRRSLKMPSQKRTE